MEYFFYRQQGIEIQVWISARSRDQAFYNNFAFQILHCYCYYYDYFFVYRCLFNSSNDINMSNESKNVDMFGNWDLDKNITFYRCRIRGTYE